LIEQRKQLITAGQSACSAISGWGQPLSLAYSTRTSFIPDVTIVAVINARAIVVAVAVASAAEDGNYFLRMLVVKSAASTGATYYCWRISTRNWCVAWSFRRRSSWEVLHSMTWGKLADLLMRRNDY